MCKSGAIWGRGTVVLSKSSDEDESVFLAALHHFFLGGRLGGRSFVARPGFATGSRPGGIADLCKSDNIL
jgi:hypothetical protein